MRRRHSALISIAAALLVATSSACRANRPAGAITWIEEVAFETDAKLGGCVVADVDPTRPGNEIAVVASTGEVFVVFHDPDAGWQSERIAELPGEMIQIAAGDLDPANPGDELVAVGAAIGVEDEDGAGAAWVLGHGAEGWTAEKVFEDEALLHAVCVGDFRPYRPGVEALVAGYSSEVFVLAPWDAGWDAVSVARVEGQAKGATPFEGGAAIATTAGQVVLVEDVGAEGWSETVLAEFDSPQARITARGAEILVCDNGGELHLVDAEGSRLLLFASSRLRGAVIADLVPNRDGVEYATAGYDGDVTVVTLGPGDSDATITLVGHDADRLHHLAAGEILGRGMALVACGYSGRVLVCWSEAW